MIQCIQRSRPTLSREGGRDTVLWIKSAFLVTVGEPHVVAEGTLVVMVESMRLVAQIW